VQEIIVYFPPFLWRNAPDTLIINTEKPNVNTLPDESKKS